MRAIDLGVIFFRQTGHARWEAMPILVDGLSKVMVGLSQRVVAKVDAKLGRLEKSGDWSLSGVVPAGPLRTSRRDREAAEARRADPEHPRLRGIRSLGEWLGRPSFLPSVAADASGVAIAPRGGINDGTIRCEEKAAGTYAIRSEKPLDGSYVVQPAADEDHASPSWSRSLTFVRNAHVHRSSVMAKGTPVAEWSDVVTMRDKVAAPVEGWCEIDPGSTI